MIRSHLLPRPYPHHTQRAETHPQAAQASRRYCGGGAARPTGIGAQLGNEVAVEEIEPRQPARAPWQGIHRDRARELLYCAPNTVIFCVVRAGTNGRIVIATAHHLLLQLVIRPTVSG